MSHKETKQESSYILFIMNLIESRSTQTKQGTAIRLVFERYIARFLYVVVAP